MDTRGIGLNLIDYTDFDREYFEEDIFDGFMTYQAKGLQIVSEFEQMSIKAQIEDAIATGT